MAVVSTNIKIDEELKKDAQELFADLGMNLTTAVNVFLRQAIRFRGIPFRIRADEIPNEETREAIAEARRLKQDPNKKVYHSFDEIIAELDAEEAEEADAKAV
ncbi:type II toxin-antitoxin system RelB/DinJ family antitoxin [Selenomonas sp. TAMA-11512]|uniref:type II toxin-antitoxin system RelB/DinJ family antitoxin n=1 Tax=Selenomonas sp. TAMA-11512 TaxID=3095337 RepID=UPI003086E8A5|nr:type II toxin-antitoxin system RelB/DinJ family antitoxin [Selenomonas sp. TAMA-11512]